MTAIGGLVELLPFVVSWDENTEEYVATTTAYPALYYRAATKPEALHGLKELIACIDLDDEE